MKEGNKVVVVNKDSFMYGKVGRIIGILPTKEVDLFKVSLKKGGGVFTFLKYDLRKVGEDVTDWLASFTYCYR